MDANATTRTTAKVRIIITSSARPKRCSICHIEIATYILATSPRNPRRHLIQIPTAYIVDNEGLPLCAECAKEDARYLRMAWEIAQLWEGRCNEEEAGEKAA